MSETVYYAHTRQGEGMEPELQTVAEHLLGTAQLSKRFAAAFGAGEYGELAGLLHDWGKCTPEFQRRLLKNGPIVDHATAGALLAALQDQDAVAACIAGHHGGLLDRGNGRQDQPGDPTLFGRLKKGIKENHLAGCGDSGVTTLSNLPKLQFPDRLQESFWTRMLYSCLVDADYLDTEQFMRGEQRQEDYDTIPQLWERFQRYIQRWQDPQTTLNQFRWKVLQTCIQAGTGERGLYSLTVPTGGGKTVSSLAFALRHAMEQGMERVIYVIPYTSIIEQNAQVFRDILGEWNVLEHHSGVSFDDSEELSERLAPLALATENWDIPVVVTTTVQFFESFYAARSSQCRKLHNLANSVIIFDETQLLPQEHLLPCTAAIGSLVEQFRSTVILCTATQPVLGDLLQRFAPSHPLREIVPDLEPLFDAFRRVTFRQAGTLEDEELARALFGHEQVLCVVNSREGAQTLYQLLPEEGRYHLSTMLCPIHRQALLEEIRDRLRSGLPCRVISTSLIEAGVDVDFPLVYRELAGMDSILQAAGRCNREGKRDPQSSLVTIFERTGKAPRQFGKAIQSTRETLRRESELDVPQTVAAYFQSLRDLTKGELDQHKVVDAFLAGVDGRELPFRTVAEHFRMIERNTWTIYIPKGEGIALLEDLQAGACSRALYRKLNRYAVSVYENQYRDLAAAGILVEAPEVPGIGERSAILTDASLYDEKLGLVIKPSSGEALLL